MYVVRRWSVRYLRQLKITYQALEAVLSRLHPLWTLVGYERVEPYFQFDERQQEGVRICIELIQQITEINGIAGVHVMAYRQKEMVAEIIQKSDVLNGRPPSMLSMLRDL